LAAIRGVPPPVVQALKGRWVATAEEVLAMSATPEGGAGLRALLSFDDQQLQTLLDTLRAEVGALEAKRLERATPGGARGVILSEEEKRRFK
jgi:hypothetical protein